MSAWKTGNLAEQLKKKSVPAEKPPMKEAAPIPPAPVVVVAEPLKTPATPPLASQKSKPTSPTKTEVPPTAPLPAVEPTAPTPVAALLEEPDPAPKAVQSPTTTSPLSSADPVLPLPTKVAQEPEPVVSLPREFAALVDPTRFNFSGEIPEVTMQPPTHTIAHQPAPQHPRRPAGNATPPPREGATFAAPPPPQYDYSMFAAAGQNPAFFNQFPQQFPPTGGRPTRAMAPGMFNTTNMRGGGGGNYRGGQFANNFNPMGGAPAPMGNFQRPFFGTPYYPPQGHVRRGPPNAEVPQPADAGQE